MQEDWDDSTVSSNISKMRIQNRLEATTRRERALAYALTQQVHQESLFENKERKERRKTEILLPFLFAAKNMRKEETEQM